MSGEFFTSQDKIPDSLFTCTDLMLQNSILVPSTSPTHNYDFCHFQGHKAFIFTGVPFSQYHEQVLGLDPTNPSKLECLVVIYCFPNYISIYYTVCW